MEDFTLFVTTRTTQEHEAITQIDQLLNNGIEGQDTNLGRVLCAVGCSGVAVQPERLALWFSSPEDDGPPLQLVEEGQPYDVDEARAAAILAHHDVDITVDLGLGGAEATLWTCDLSHDYVRINAHYRTRYVLYDHLKPNLNQRTTKRDAPNRSILSPLISSVQCRA